MSPALQLALAVAAPLLMMVGVRHTLERRWPAHLRRTRRHGVSLTAWAALFVGTALSGPALGGLVTPAVNAAGGGLIALPARGPGWWAGLAVYFVAMDLGEYLFHRAQHAIPALGPCTRCTTATAPSIRPRPPGTSGWSRRSRR